MTRNPNPYTERQIRLLEGIHQKLKEINDPDPDVITHETYQWYTKQTKEFGKIPKLRLKPGSMQKKAELIVRAQLDNPERQEKISALRRKYGIKKARNTEPITAAITIHKASLASLRRPKAFSMPSLLANWCKTQTAPTIIP